MRIYHQIVVLVIGAVLAIGLAFAIWSESRLTQQINDNAAARGTMIARLLATSDIDYRIESDVEQVDETLRRAVDQAVDIADAFVVDKDGGIVAHTFEDGIPDPIVRSVIRYTAGDDAHIVNLHLRERSLDLLGYPLSDGGTSAVYLLLDRDYIQGLIHGQRLDVLAVALLVMTLGALAAVPISRRISDPLRRATDIIAAYGRGETVADADLTALGGGPEVTELSTAFHDMQHQLSTALASLHDRERRLAEVERVAHIGHWRWDRSAEEFECSSECHRITGRSGGDSFTNYPPLLGCTHPDDQETGRQAFDACMRSGGDLDLQLRIVRPSGEERIVAAHGEVFQDENGANAGMIGTMQDITEQVRAEERTTRMGRILDNSLNEIYVFDAETFRFLQANNGARKNLGYDMDELRRLAPWDIKPDLTEAEFRQLVAPLVDGEQELLTFECIHERKNGSRYPADVHLQLFQHEEPAVFVAIINDATERRKHDERLRLAAEVFNSVAEGIVITDPQRRVVDVNPAFTQNTGWHLEELHGKSAQVLRSDRHPPSFYRELEDRLREDGQWQGEFWDRHKDGTTNPKRLSITAVPGEDGKIAHYVAVHADISKEKRAEAELNRLAHTDTLTGLPNRALFNDRLSMELKRTERRGNTCALLFVDIDRFKNINDTLGHYAGDQVLREISRRLLACIRGEDTVARLSGDEFTVILGSLDGPQSAEEVAQRIVRSLSQPIACDGQDLAVTASVGIALYPTNAQNMDNLVRCADKAMYAVKQSGRAGYRFYTADMDVGDADAQRTEAELRRALARNELELYFQPRYDLGKRAVGGAEALVRWNHPTRGLVPPDDFIPIAEDNGLIVPLGRFVLREACRQARKWFDDGLVDGAVSVNLSARQLRDPALIDDIRSILRETRLPPSKLELELTESLVMDDAEASIGRLYELRDMGLSIAIDDFGTGHSSLAYLKRLPVQALKIDRAFVGDLEGDSDDATIVNAIIGLAHSLGLTVVAEGVETIEQAVFLIDNGCHELQGYYLSKPVAASDFPQAVAKANELVEACFKSAASDNFGTLVELGIERAS